VWVCKCKEVELKREEIQIPRQRLCYILNRSLTMETKYESGHSQNRSVDMARA